MSSVKTIAVSPRDGSFKNRAYKKLFCSAMDIIQIHNRFITHVTEGRFLHTESIVSHVVVEVVLHTDAVAAYYQRGMLTINFRQYCHVGKLKVEIANHA